MEDELNVIFLGALLTAFAIWGTVQIIDRGIKQGRGFWITLGLVAWLGLYTLGFGPACWVSSYAGHGAGLVSVVYQPLMAFWWRGRPLPARPDSLMKYAQFAAKKQDKPYETSGIRLRGNSWYCFYAPGQTYPDSIVAPSVISQRPPLKSPSQTSHLDQTVTNGGRVSRSPDNGP